MNALISGTAKVLQESLPPEQVEIIQKQAQARYEELMRENAGEPAALRLHTKQNIYPAIALYETMCDQDMDQDRAIMAIDEYYRRSCGKTAELLRLILKIPGLYHKVPAIFTQGVLKMFGTDAGFRHRFPENPISAEMRFDMLECPYYETCLKYGCPELCRVFCDSDDVSYGNMHPRLKWGRTKTLGKGGDCCDFRLTDLSRSDLNEKGRLKGPSVRKARMTRRILNTETDIRKYLITKLGEEDGHRIYRHQIRHYKDLVKMLQKSGKSRSQRKALYTILAEIALYQALQDSQKYSKKAYMLTESYLIEIEADRLHGRIAKMEKIPGFFTLYKKILAFSTRHSDLWDGVCKETHDRLFLKITRCTWNEACREAGCPELAPAFCQCGDVIYGDLKKLGFHRTRTLGCGENSCNFCFYRQER